VDLAHRHLAKLSELTEGLEFQSLLSWISPIGSGELLTPIAASTAFQSLLSWISPIGLSTLPSVTLTDLEFQSLLSWISPIGPSVGPWSRYRCRVSILVVVDLAHRRVDSAAGGHHWRVSILVVVDLAHRPGVRSPIAVAQVGFQSLLSWISPIGQAVADCPDWGDIVSILVVVDLAHRPPNPDDRGHRIRRVSILVVVDLAHRPRRRLAAVLVADEFQSLLSWISPIGSVGVLVRVSALDVSILVVVDLAHRPSKAIPDPSAVS